MFKVLFLLFGFVLPLLSIEAYQPFIKQYLHENERYLVSRTFLKNHERYYLITHTQTFQTTLASLEHSNLLPLDNAFYKTPLARALHYATSLHVKGGLAHAMSQKDGAIYLTMDLCPSRKRGYEQAFTEYVSAYQAKTPIAIAVSSGWIKNHEASFEALKNHPKLSITWVNHTHTHFYDPHLKEHENFMLHSSTDVEKEILGLEQTLIEHGVTPSIFFRFPGLKANASLMKALKERFFLIPLSADAWIAKSEPIKESSFILVHGNKNEPLGIEMLEKMLPELMKNYRFSPIQEAF